MTASSTDDPGLDALGQHIWNLIRASEFQNSAELAAAAGVAHSTITRFLGGKAGIGFEVLRKIAPFLGTTLGRLLVIGGMATADELITGPPEGLTEDDCAVLDVVDASPEIRAAIDIQLDRKIPKAHKGVARKLVGLANDAFITYRDNPATAEPQMRSRTRATARVPATRGGEPA